MAQSDCQPTVLNPDFGSDNWVYSTTPDQRTSAGTYTWVNPTGDGTDLTMSITAQTLNPNTRWIPTNMVLLDPAGGTGTTGINFGLQDMHLPQARYGAAIDVTFSRPVSNLTFTMSDIHGYAGATTTDGLGQERLANRSSILTGTKQNTNYLRGDGSITNPWVGKGDNTFNPNNNTQGAGNVNFAASGDVTTFSMRYWLGAQIDRASNSGLAGNIYLTNLKFQNVTDNPCPD